MSEWKLTIERRIGEEWGLDDARDMGIAEVFETLFEDVQELVLKGSVWRLEAPDGTVVQMTPTGNMMTAARAFDDHEED